jgi:hypothetical protein
VHLLVLIISVRWESWMEWQTNFLEQYKQPTSCKNFVSLIFQSALHVSGVNYAHPQEHLTVFTAFGIMHRRCCRPAIRLLHLLVCLHFCTSDARSHNHQLFRVMWIGPIWSVTFIYEWRHTAVDELLALHYRRATHFAYRHLCQCKAANRLISSVLSCTVH